MSDSPIRIMVATDNIASIGALKGNYILDDGGELLCVMHQVPRALLSGHDPLEAISSEAPPSAPPIEKRVAGAPPA